MRVKGGTTRHKRHKKIRKDARGFRGYRGRTIKGAKEGILHALSNAYIGRKRKKREMRSLWITRLNAALREQDMKYSTFIQQLNTQNVQLNRKVLSDIAYQDPETFAKIANQIKDAA